VHARATRRRPTAQGLAWSGAASRPRAQRWTQSHGLVDPRLSRCAPAAAAADADAAGAATAHEHGPPAATRTHSPAPFATAATHAAPAPGAPQLCLLN